MCFLSSWPCLALELLDTRTIQFAPQLCHHLPRLSCTLTLLALPSSSTLPSPRLPLNSVLVNSSSSLPDRYLLYQKSFKFASWTPQTCSMHGLFCQRLSQLPAHTRGFKSQCAGAGDMAPWLRLLTPKHLRAPKFGSQHPRWAAHSHL